MTLSNTPLNPAPDTVSLHDRRKSFPADPTTESPAIAFVGTKFTALFEADRNYTLDLSTLPLPTLAREAARLLWVESQPLGSYWSPAALKSAGTVLRSFATFFVTTGQNERVTSLASITADDFAGFEAWLRKKLPPESGEPYRYLSRLRALMLTAQRHGLAAPSLAARLNYIADGPSNAELAGKRDAYSAHVARQVREGAWRDIEAAVQRIAVDGPLLAASGEDPKLHGQWSDANVAWAISNTGLTVLGENVAFHRRKRDMSGDLSHHDILSMFHLNLSDVFAITTLISLEAGLPIESVQELKVDCLRNETRGYADICYVKRRGGTITERVKRIKVDGARSPGSIIKIVQNLTQHSRRIAPVAEAQWLLLGCAMRRDGEQNAIRRLRPKRRHSEQFCSRHAISDDRLQPLVSVARPSMRKTYKANQYRQANGHLADAADDHTKSVHAQHYANIPALADLHEATVAEGLEQALESAMRPTILTSADEQQMLDDPEGASKITGLSQEELEAVSSGDGDVWFATCLGFQHSPFAKPGDKRCPVPVWGCLVCKNAVITSSKLPAILAFLNYVLQRRQEMDLRAWSIRFGVAHERIVKGILPRFPPSEVALARTIAAAEGQLLWLPVELTMTR